MLLHSL